MALRAAVATGAGVLIYLSSPPRTLWWLAPLGFALLGAVLYGRRARAGFGYARVRGPRLHGPAARVDR